MTEEELRQEVYAVLLDVHIWTRPGNGWYNPDYPEFSDRVDAALKEYETRYLPEVEKKRRPMPKFGGRR